jgi:hypothetical protein
MRSHAGHLNDMLPVAAPAETVALSIGKRTGCERDDSLRSITAIGPAAQLNFRWAQ